MNNGSFAGLRLGVAAIARPTFDVSFAEETARAAFMQLEGFGVELIGGPALLLDDDAVEMASAQWAANDMDALVILQASFTDSTLPVALAESADAPLVLWGFPEERTGGRLRLNSLCGINLAAFALRRLGHDYRWLYRDPSDADAITDLLQAVAGPGVLRSAPVDCTEPDPAAQSRAADIRLRLGGSTVGIIGDRPTGFEPCGYDPAELEASTGVVAEATPLTRLFDLATRASHDEVAAVRSRFAADLRGLDDLDQESLERSLRLHVGLRCLVADAGWSAVATRCWPECFTEVGAAACSAQALLSETGVPACCEADAYGTVTGMVLQWLTGQPTFVADLVELDRAEGTGVMWHCGLAPISMADPSSIPRAAVHGNREKPLLNEFPLRPGRVTIARFSQSAGEKRLLVGGGEMMSAPLAFGGTAGVLRFDRPVADVLATVMGEGLEHHYGIGYGDVRAELRALGQQLDLPIIVL